MPWLRNGLRPVRIALVLRILSGGVWGAELPRMKPRAPLARVRCPVFGADSARIRGQTVTLFVVPAITPSF